MENTFPGEESEEMTPEQINNRSKKEAEVESIDNYVAEGNQMAQNASDDNAGSQKSIEDKLNDQFTNYTVGLKSILDKKMDGVRERAYEAEVEKYRMADNPNGLVKTLRAVGLMKTPDYGAMVELDDGVLLETAVQETIKEEKIALAECQVIGEKRKKIYDNVRAEEMERKRDRNRLYDKIQEGRIKLDAVEELITEDAKLRMQYLEAREQPGYNGEHDALLSDVELRLQENEEKRENLNNTLQSLGEGLMLVNQKYKTAKTKSMKAKYWRTVVDKAVHGKKSEIEGLCDLMENQRQNDALMDQLNYLFSASQGVGNEIRELSMKHEAELMKIYNGKLQGESYLPDPGSGIAAATEVGRSVYDNAIEEALADVAADRYT